MITTDLHTHTVFSDGKNTAEEMIIAAIEKGLTTIGVADHAYEPFDDCCIKFGGDRKYKEEINRLKRLYGEQITVLCGIEYDYYSQSSLLGYDYVIGSSHYIVRNGKVYSVDSDRTETLRCINEAFGGDKYAFAEAYYEQVSNLYEKVGATVIGHFDLITKFEKFGVSFDEDNPRYKNAYMRALRKLAPYCAIEINTGGMTRGYKDKPYPSEKILQEIKAFGGRIAFGSDAHRASDIAAHFDSAYKLAEECHII